MLIQLFHSQAFQILILVNQIILVLARLRMYDLFLLLLCPNLDYIHLLHKVRKMQRLLDNFTKFNEVKNIFKKSVYQNYIEIYDYPQRILLRSLLFGTF